MPALAAGPRPIDTRLLAYNTRIPFVSRRFARHFEATESRFVFTFEQSIDQDKGDCGALISRILGFHTVYCSPHTVAFGTVTMCKRSGSLELRFIYAENAFPAGNGRWFHMRR